MLPSLGLSIANGHVHGFDWVIYRGGWVWAAAINGCHLLLLVMAPDVDTTNTLHVCFLFVIQTIHQVEPSRHVTEAFGVMPPVWAASGERHSAHSTDVATLSGHDS